MTVYGMFVLNINVYLFLKIENFILVTLPLKTVSSERWYNIHPSLFSFSLLMLLASTNMFYFIAVLFMLA